MQENEKHLFVLEGKDAETKYLDMLERSFMGRSISVKCVFDAEIYQLYEQLKREEFAVDLVSVLKERSRENAERLKDCSPNSFAGIYLFFDYDGHSSLADDEKLAEMLEYFDNETENGNLYVSYPMVEAIRHFRDMESYRDLTAKCKRGTSFENMNCPRKSECKDVESCLAEAHYKSISGNEGKYSDIRKYSDEVWKTLIKANVFKMNYLVNDDYCMPEDVVSQRIVFEKQLAKHISNHCPKVAVLSAFPLYVLDYYGVSKLKDKLESSKLSSI